MEARKEKGKAKWKGTLNRLSAVEAAVTIWSNSSFQLILLFFLDTLVYIWVEKTLPEGSLSLNIMGHVLSSMFMLGLTREFMCMHSFEAVRLPVNKIFLEISTTRTIAVSIYLQHLLKERVFLHCPFLLLTPMPFLLFPSFLNAIVTWVSSIFLLQSCTGWVCPGWLEIAIFHCKPGYLEKQQAFDDGD